MKTQLQQKCELFVSNVQTIKKQFPWQYIAVKRLAALLYASQNKAIDCDLIRESLEHIKKNTNFFSSFRGNSVLTVATFLSLSDNKEKLLNDAIQVYNMLKEEKFRSSDYLVMAAYQIAAGTDPHRYSLAVKRARSFYSGMKEEHFVLTSYDDYIFSAMLGLSDIDVSLGLKRMENLYSTLKPKLRIGNSVQALAQVLVLGNEPEGLETRVLTLRDKFKKTKMRLDKVYTLPTLGILALLPVDIDETVESVKGIYRFLRSQKGFGKWSISKQELLLLSSGLFSFDCMEEVQKGLLTTALSTSITNIIIAQQTAVIVATTSSAAAASSSN